MYRYFAILFACFYILFCCTVKVSCNIFSNTNNNTNPQVLSSMGVGALGRIEPSSKVLSLFDDSGPDGARVEILHVQEGQLVKQGDLLVTFSSNNRKKISLDLACAKEQDLEEQIRLQQVAYDIAERSYNRYKSLLQTKSISAEDTDKSYANLNSAEIKLNALKSDYDTAKLATRSAEDDLKRTFLTAPIDGTILKIKSYQGEKPSSKGIIDIADLSKFDIMAEVYERDISKVAKDQKAEIFIDGIEKKFEAVVSQIYYQVYKNQVNDTDPLAPRDNRIVEVRISLNANQEDLDIIKHMIFRQVKVRILTEK